MRTISVIWKGIQVSLGMLLIAGLLFASSVLAVLLYAKMTGTDLFGNTVAEAMDGSGDNAAAAAFEPAAEEQEPKPPPLPESAMIDAPLVRQLPELPAGCEVTSLTMLLQYYGIEKTKMELVPEMKVDTTPIQRDAKGNITYWGNPNLGFVGDVTRKKIGFGIYHAALFELLEKYVPTAVDLTGGKFEDVERSIAEGIPVVVWTTVNFKAPASNQWLVWDTPIGPIKTTFKLHAVLLVGYDKDNVYVNDPLSGKAKLKIDKKQFMETWDALGKQAITYTQP